jgi:hypothetical protein
VQVHTACVLWRYGNGLGDPTVYCLVKFRLVSLVYLIAACSLWAEYTGYTAARQKFDLIESGRLRPGARVVLTPAELTAYAQHELPAGVTSPRLQIVSPGVVTGTAMIDFGKVRRAQGYRPGWLMSRLLDGDRPVSVTARIQSGGGRATVTVQRVDVGGLEIDGRTLDFLIQNFLIPMYPDAAVGRPFELGHRIDRLDVQPTAVGVIIR